MIQKRPSKLIKQFPVSEPIVNMAEFEKRLYVATSRRLYILVGDKLEPLKIVRHKGGK